MISPAFLTEPDQTLVADASVAINLNAAGCAPALVSALQHRLLITDIAAAELRMDRRNGRDDAALLMELVEGKLLQIVSLDAPALEIFERLVVGSAGETLEDGEAASIAYAVQNRACCLTDDRKAQLIGSQRFPDLRLASTMDLFSDRRASIALGADVLSESIFLAMRDARMRVPAHKVEWVIGLIGHDRARQCPSLPRTVRERTELPP